MEVTDVSSPAKNLPLPCGVAANPKRNGQRQTPRGRGKLTKQCPVCGRTFSPANKKVITCSRECSGLRLRGFTNNTVPGCFVCGTALKRNQTKFCSYRCSAIGRFRQVARICCVCGKEFLVHASRADMAKACSYKCGQVASRRREIRECPACGNSFECVRSSKKVTCSRICQAYWFRKYKTAPKTSDPGYGRWIYRNNRRRISESNRNSYKRNKKKYAIRSRNYGFRKRGSFGKRGDEISRYIKRMVQRVTVRCYYCNKRIPGSNINFDHIVPLHAGGRNTADNICCACKTCNSSKGCKPLVEWSKGKLAQPLMI